MCGRRRRSCSSLLHNVFQLWEVMCRQSWDVCVCGVGVCVCGVEVCVCRVGGVGVCMCPGGVGGMCLQSGRCERYLSTEWDVQSGSVRSMCLQSGRCEGVCLPVGVCHSMVGSW